MNNRETRIIAVANEKGGVGKTVAVINLAAALAKSGQKALVVDVDPQANATQGLGVTVEDSQRSVYGLVNAEDGVDAREAVVNTAWQNLDLIPSHIDLAGSEVELVDVEGRENLLKDGLMSVVPGYDFVLLDTPPSLSLLTINVFAAATEVLVPCQTHPYAYNALAELFDTIAAVRQEINPGLKVTGIVATFFDQRTRVSHRILNKLRTDENYRRMVFNTVIRVNTTIADSADVGKPVVFYRSSSTGAMDFMDLAEELTSG